MNNLVNRVQLIGNLGKDPEVLEMEKGSKLTKFSVATNESYKDKEGEKIQQTQWHNIIAWGKTAELAEDLLHKGTRVLVEGKLTNNTWDDKDGNKRYSTEIVMNDFLLLSPKVEELVE